jgi:hypothetical protein
MLYICVVQTGRERRVGTHRTSWPIAFAFIAVVKRIVLFWWGEKGRQKRIKW